MKRSTPHVWLTGHPLASEWRSDHSSALSCTKWLRTANDKAAHWVECVTIKPPLQHKSMSWNFIMTFVAVQLQTDNMFYCISFIFGGTLTFCSLTSSTASHTFSVSNVNLLLCNLLWSFALFMWASLVYLHIRKKLPLMWCLIHGAVLSIETSQLRERVIAPMWPGPTPRPPSLAAYCCGIHLQLVFKLYLYNSSFQSEQIWSLGAFYQ